LQDLKGFCGGKVEDGGYICALKDFDLNKFTRYALVVHVKRVE
jgi:hypothetical protein